MKPVLFITMYAIPVICMAQGEKKNDWTGQGLKGKVKTVRTCLASSENIEALRNTSFSDKDYWVDSFSNTGQYLKYYSISDGKFITKIDYKYDIRGSLIEEMINDNGAITKMTYNIKYDSAGNEIELKIFENSVSQGWTRSKYKMGKLTEVEDSSVLLGKSIIVYQYDDKGRVMEKEVYNPSHPEDKSIGKYQYDDKGNIKELAWYNTNRTLQERVAYKYDDHNTRILLEYFDNNGKLKSSYADEYIYDSTGNFLRHISKSSLDNVLSIDIREIIYY